MDPEMTTGGGTGGPVLRAVCESVDDGVVVHDSDGTVLAVNGVAADLFDRPREAIDGAGPGALTAENGPSGEALLAALRHVAGAGTGQPSTPGGDEGLTVEDDACEWRVAEGSWVRGEVTSVTADGSDRLVVTLRAVDREVDGDDHGPAAERQLYRTLVERSRDGVVVVQDGVFRFANEAMAALTGRSVADLEGLSYREVIAPEYHDRLAERYERRVNGEEPPNRYHVEVVTADGERRDVELSASAIQFRGEPAALARYRDVTDHKRRERELEDLTTRFELALEGTDTGVWEWNLDTDEVVWDETSEELFGYEPGTFSGDSRDFEERVPDEDLARIRRAVERALETGEAYEAEFRVEHPDGETRWIQARGVVTDDGDVTSPQSDDSDEQFADWGSVTDDGILTSSEATDSGRMVGVQTDVTERKRRERELEDLTTRLELALEGTDTGVWEWDLTADEVVWDETSEELFGYESGDFSGTYDGFERRVPDEDLAQVERALQRAFETGKPYETEFRVERPDGETRWLQARGVVTDEGEITTGPEATDSGRMLGVQTDVTERKRRERELEELATRLELALEETDAGVWEWDLDTDEVVWDEATEELFGYEPGSFPGTPEAVRRRIHSDDFLRVVEEIEQAIETGGEYRTDFRVVHPDGEVRWLQGRGVVEYEDGEPDRMLGIHSDITERKRRERELEELTTRFELAMEETRTGVWEWDLDTDEVVWNEPTERLFGYEPGEFPGTYDAFIERVHPDDVDEVERAVQRTLEVGSEYRTDLRVQRPGGETRWIQARGVVEYDGDGPERMLGVQTDITERKRRERELEDLTTRLELALEGTDTGVWEWDLAADEVVWDETSEELFGYEPGEFPGTYEGFARRVPDEDLAQAERSVQRVFETGKPYQTEFRVERPDGETRWIQARGVVTDEGETTTGPEAIDSGQMTGVFTDVTERKRRERELEELTTRFELALEETGTGVWEWDLDTDEIIWDEATERVYGYGPDGFPGTYQAFVERVHPDDVDDVEQALQRAIETGGEYRTDLRVRRLDGDTRWIQARGFVEYEDGEPDRMVGVQTDITERKRRERELEAQNERLELLNRIVRHDIRNDMEIIRSATGIVEERLEDADVDVTETLTRLQRSADHVVELTEVVRDIMETTRGESTVEPIYLGRVLEAELGAVRSMDGVTVEAPDPPSVRVLADDSLGTVVHNLLTNAVRHNDSEEPTVEVSVTERDDRVVLRVADDGPGVPADRREEVFARGEKGLDSPGSGLGLYLVDRLVDEYGGDVWIEDNDPRGAVFAVELRRAGTRSGDETGTE